VLVALVKLHNQKLINFINKKKRSTMNKQELFETMLDLWNEFEGHHNGTTKKSQQQARKSVGELKKLVTDYRKASVAEGK
jgi:hypothetical protein